MRNWHRLLWALAVMQLVSTPVLAQQRAPAPAPAATVNGEAIPEVAVQRGLQSVPPAKLTEARGEVLNILIDNVLVSQYLTRSQIAVDKKDVDARIDEFRGNDKAEFDKTLKRMMMTEDELRVFIANELRWEKYLASQTKEQALREFFEKHRDMFDGSLVRARHILLKGNPSDAQANEAAKAQLAAMKKQVEVAVVQGLAKLKPETDNLTREKERARLTEEAFASLARDKSACPSKEEGGDVGWFPRAGVMVEPFAQAAFALKPYEMSGVVMTQFGHHLILTTDRRPGKEVKFEDRKEAVKLVIGEQMRQSLCTQLKQNARIVINLPPKQ